MRRPAVPALCGVLLAGLAFAAPAGADDDRGRGGDPFDRVIERLVEDAARALDRQGEDAGRFEDAFEDAFEGELERAREALEREADRMRDRAERERERWDRARERGAGDGPPGRACAGPAAARNPHCRGAAVAAPFVPPPPGLPSVPAPSGPAPSGPAAVAPPQPPTAPALPDPPAYVIGSPFDEAAFAPYAGTGNASLTGQATLVLPGGTAVPAAHSPVVLVPDTAYTRELLEPARSGRYAGVANFDPRYFDYRRTTTADADGIFRFPGIPAGDYIVQTSIRLPDGRGEAFLHDRVTVAAGTGTTVLLTGPP